MKETALSQAERESLLTKLFPLRGHFDKPNRTPDAVEGVVFRCVDRRLPDGKQTLGLGDAFYAPREPGAVIHGPEYGNKAVESNLVLGLGGHAPEHPAPPHSVFILGHDDCQAALIGVQDLLQPGSVKGEAAAVAEHMRGVLHPQLAAALKGKATADLAELHQAMTRSTVLSSMLNASHYRLGHGPRVHDLMDKAQAQIIGGIEGLKPQAGGPLLYNPHAREFEPLEKLYDDALGGNRQTAGEIEEAVKRQLKRGVPHVQLGAKKFLHEMEAAIAHELTRIEALKVR